MFYVLFCDSRINQNICAMTTCISKLTALGKSLKEEQYRQLLQQSYLWQKKPHANLQIELYVTGSVPRNHSAWVRRYFFGGCPMIRESDSTWVFFSLGCPISHIPWLNCDRWHLLNCAYTVSFQDMVCLVCYLVMTVVFYSFQVF